MKKLFFLKNPLKFNHAFCSVALTLSFIFLLNNSVVSQTSQDTIVVPIQVEKEKKGSIFSGRPGKSLLMSLVVPGAGQIYNKSYLRVPIIWGAVGGMGLLLKDNIRAYNCYRDAYIDKIDGIPVTVPHYCNPIPFSDDINEGKLQTASSEAIREARDQANVNRQWAIIGFTLVWLANGVDAFVDAHLKEFDIDEDLSIDIGPRIDEDSFAPMKMGIFVQF